MSLAGPSPGSIVVNLPEDANTKQYGCLVQKIKSLSDVMVVAKMPAIASRQLVEKALTAGFHALIFTAGEAGDVAAMPGAVPATNIFAPGAVFLSFDGPIEEEGLREIISRGLVPLCSASDDRVDSLLAQYGMDGKWLYFLGYYRAGPLGMRDRVRKKYLLEMANLKHKLRVSQADESYQSSSL
jgi:hypothetical protein